MRHLVMYIIYLVFFIGVTCLLTLKDCHQSKQVESFCSIKYRYDVEKYKSCKDLSIIKLIQQLEEELKEQNNIITLPDIK